jgi:hypothetical protein
MILVIMLMIKAKVFNLYNIMAVLKVETNFDVSKTARPM